MDAILAPVDNLVAAQQASAAQLAISHDETFSVRRAVGSAGDHPITHSDPVLVASITKPMTATAVMQLVEAGDIALDDPVSTYFPAFTGDGRDLVTVYHLLTHTSGLPNMLAENESLRRRNEPNDVFVDRTVEASLRFEPGAETAYQSMGTNLAGAIVEHVSGLSLRAYLREHVFEPLGMHDTMLGLGDRSLADVVPCDVEPAAGDPGYDRWDWNSRYWRDFGAPWGGAHSTATDLLKFLTAFLDDGGPILGAETVAAMTKLQTPGHEEAWGLGFQLGAERDHFGAAVSPATFGHAGATGCVAWADPTRELVFACLTTLPLADQPEDFLGTCSTAAVEAIDSLSS